jgi:general L-amino acid transport system permease protein
MLATPFNAAITLGCLVLTMRCLWWAVDWLFLQADFHGARPDCAAAHGTCWPFITVKLRFMLFGTYPYAEQWRPTLALAIFFLALGVSMHPRSWRRCLIPLWLLILPALATLIWGGWLGLPYVATQQLSGLLLTTLLTFIGIVGGFPLGVVLALARIGSLPAFRTIATLLIEIVRSLPLVTILFIFTIMGPLLVPAGVTVGVLWRVQVAIVVFAGAYIAETLRGALQAIPRQQYEAAQSLGLRYWPTMALIIVPQALRISIPALVIIVIGFFQDTALVTIVGLLDFLSTVRAAMHDPNWEGTVVVDGYLCAAAVYFAISYGLGAYGRFLERRTHAAAV